MKEKRAELPLIANEANEVVRGHNMIPVTEEMSAACVELQHRVGELGDWIIDNCPFGRRASLALTNLEQCELWALSAIVKDTEPDEGDDG